MKVRLDCDGVLSDFAGAWVAAANAAAGTNYTVNDVTDFGFENLDLPADAVRAAWRAVSLPGACAALAVYPGAVDFVERLRARHEVVIVTTPLKSSPTWASEREGWLMRHFGFGRADIIHTAGKHHIPGVLVDDNIGNCNAHVGVGGAILLDRPYNQGVVVGYAVSRARNYDEVLDTLDYVV